MRVPHKFEVGGREVVVVACSLLSVRAEETSAKLHTPGSVEGAMEAAETGLPADEAGIRRGSEEINSSRTTEELSTVT